MTRIITALYGAAVYLFFLGTFLYAIGFVGNLGVPQSIDSGVAAPWAEAVLVNALLLGVFAIQHSVMARPAFKRAWTRIVPRAAERSTYVLFASLALALLFWKWRPMPDSVWTIDDPVATILLDAVFWLGWSLVLVSTFLISHFELFGLRQAFARLLNIDLPAPEFRTPMFYRYVRHPIYLGFMLAFWSTPHMTQGHLLFAMATTAYILVGIRLEEHDLIELFGERYRRYRAQVGMLMPNLMPKIRRRASTSPPSSAAHRQSPPPDTHTIGQGH